MLEIERYLHEASVDELAECDASPWRAIADLRGTCAPSATYAAEPYEEQLARVFDGVRLTEADVDQVLAAMRRVEPVAPAPDPVDVDAARAELQRQLAAGKLTIEAFSRAWRRTDRPAPAAPAMPDELRLRRARERLAELGTLWRNPAVPDRLREEALHEIFARVDVRGSQLLAVHPQPNENAWLLGLVALRQEQHVGMVGARGFEPPGPTPRIVLPDVVWKAFRDVA